MSMNFNAVCPDCNNDFEISLELLPLDVELNCPYCGNYFKKGESPKLIIPPGWTIGNQKPRFHIYRPSTPYRYSPD
jgi:DNA-directed RNA polymerase subunit RPC12/RpoP